MLFMTVKYMLLSFHFGRHLNEVADEDVFWANHALVNLLSFALIHVPVVRTVKGAIIPIVI
jgi:hypothetical protein